MTSHSSISQSTRSVPQLLPFLDSDSYVKHFQKVLQPFKLKAVPMNWQKPEKEINQFRREIERLKNIIAGQKETILGLQGENSHLRERLSTFENNWFINNSERLLSLLFKSFEAFPGELIFNPDTPCSSLPVSEIERAVQYLEELVKKRDNGRQEGRKGKPMLGKNTTTTTVYSRSQQRPQRHPPAPTRNIYNGIATATFSASSSSSKYDDNNTVQLQFGSGPSPGLIVKLTERQQHNSAPFKNGLKSREPRGDDPVASSSEELRQILLRPSVPSSSTSAAPQTKPRGNQSATETKRRGRLTKLQSQLLRKKKHGICIAKNYNRRMLGLPCWWCECGNDFSSKCTLTKHILYFTLKWKFICEICQKPFMTMSYLKHHMKSKHKIPEPLKGFVNGCHFCGTLFKEKHLYWEHRRTFHNLQRVVYQRNNNPTMAVTEENSDGDELLDV